MRDVIREIQNTFKCPKVESGKCPSIFQDRRYGKGVRIFTKVADKTVGEKRCTVCGTVK
jgi:hypothetical protein